MFESLNAFVENPIDDEWLSRLHVAAGEGPVLIMAHDNPDPDALAAGKALAALLHGLWGIRSRLVYGGLVARAENKAMLSILTPEWEQIESLSDLERYSAIALVDTQPGAGNNSLPAEIVPALVFDHHHPLRDLLKQVAYVDVRPDIGATSSLLYQYLVAARITPDEQLATAMFYGVHADTKGLSRSESPLDQAAYFYLLNLIDRRKLTQVEQAGLSRDYFRAFSRGLQAARIYGRAAVSYLGSMHRPDFVAEIADLLIRLEDIQSVLCLGFHQDRMYLSLRTAESQPDAGLAVQQIILAPGRAGGHGTVAGGQVPIAGRSAADEVAVEIVRRFLDLMGESGDGETLLT